MNKGRKGERIENRKKKQGRGKGKEGEGRRGKVMQGVKEVRKKSR